MDWEHEYALFRRRCTGNRGRAGNGKITPLKWDVFVTPAIPIVSSDLPPGGQRRMWSPIASTLIYGKRDAVIVDPFLTVSRQKPCPTGSKPAAKI
jgi:hypothetical protein